MTKREAARPMRSIARSAVSPLLCSSVSVVYGRRLARSDSTPRTAVQSSMLAWSKIKTRAVYTPTNR